MSVRFLYKKIPTEKRLCSRCNQPILRNLALDKETQQIYHYGCLQTCKDELYRCLDCGSTLDGTEISKADFGNGQLETMCGSCGSPNVRALLWREKIELREAMK